MPLELLNDAESIENIFSSVLKKIWGQSVFFSKKYLRSKFSKKIFFEKQDFRPKIKKFLKDSTLTANQSGKKKSRSGWKTSWNPIFFKSKAFERYADFVFENVQIFNQTPSGRGDRGSQSAPLDLGSGSETAILGVEKYRFAVNAKNGLLNYQKCFLIFKKIICCDFRIFFSEKNNFFGSEMWISLKI